MGRLPHILPADKSRIHESRPKSRGSRGEERVLNVIFIKQKLPFRHYLRTSPRPTISYSRIHGCTMVAFTTIPPYNSRQLSYRRIITWSWPFVTLPIEKRDDMIVNLWIKKTRIIILSQCTPYRKCINATGSSGAVACGRRSCRRIYPSPMASCTLSTRYLL
jgi:hypothetical protein